MKRFSIYRVSLPSGDESYRVFEAGEVLGGNMTTHRVLTLDERQLRRLRASIDSALEAAEAGE